MADAPIDCEFPVWGLLPKKETGVVSFVSKNPEYDGRGTIIAIFDSGVDPAATGMQVTSTGEPKVIERFDCSGCGDVDTSTVIRKLVDGCITGLTNRKLKIPEAWKNPTGEWRIGVLPAYTLYAGKLRERVQEHRKAKVWDMGHSPAFAAANKQLHDFENEISSKTGPLSLEDKLRKEELEARVEVLAAADKKYLDVGPTYDCVLFHDGSVWRACIDTSECGDLPSGPFLGEYSVTRCHAHLTPLDEMTVSVNVHDDGDTLEVVGMCSSHGTHVASIAAGHFPSEPDKNGVAPGAQIVSLTIGDSRLGSMETGTALVRACIKIMELSKRMKIDVINMSYGEHAHWSNAGRIGDIICEVVNRYNVSWVVSAGNHGPALCTVGAPPDIAQSVLIGVGAYVSPEMMSAAYSMRCKLHGGAFSWSSRGPCADGALGVCVCAPGGAVTSVPRFTLRNSQLMNGTSMAAPHVAGVVAALVSGLKAKQVPYSPYSIKRSLENAATYLSHVEPWAQGAGLVNIEKTFELLTTYHAAPERDVTFTLSCGGGAKGILIRPKPGDPPKDVSVTIEPQFIQSHTDMEDRAVIARQIAFSVRLALTCNSSWLQAPAHLDMMNAARPIAIRVDTDCLSPGGHFTSIDAYDVTCVEKGPVFRIPVTVLKPEPLKVTAGSHQLNETAVTFKPNTIRRHHVIVPLEASWGVLKMCTHDKERSGRFLIHTMQILPRESCRNHETQKMVNVTAEAPMLLPFRLQGGVALEVVIAKYWANIGDVEVDYTVEFHGLKPTCGGRVHMLAAQGLTTVQLTALNLQEVQPNAQLKYAEPPVRPTESKLSPLTARDVIPPARQMYQLINTYTFHVAKATEVSPIVSVLCDMLYESEFVAQMWMIYNSCKQLLATGDAYPCKYSVKLEKGEYTLRVCVRHEHKAQLEKLQEMPVIIQQRLTTALTLDAYCSHSQALTGGKKFNSASVSNGAILPLYFTPVPSDKIGRSNLTIGHTLTGTVTFAKDELGRKVDTYPLTYVICEPPKRPNNNKDKEKGKPHEEYVEAYKDVATTWLAKLEGDKLDQVYEELLEKCPNWPGAHVAYLAALESPTDAKKLPHVTVETDVTTAWCEQLIATADKVIKSINQEKLLAHIGMKNDNRPDATKIKQEHEKQRGYLVEALCRRGTALCRLHALSQSVAAKEKVSDAVAANHADLLKFTDLTDTKAIHYGIWHSFTLNQYGRGIKLLNKLQEDRPSKEAEERLIEAYEALGWPHLVNHAKRAMPIKYPQSYRLF